MKSSQVAVSDAFIFVVVKSDNLTEMLYVHYRVKAVHIHPSSWPVHVVI